MEFVVFLLVEEDIGDTLISPSECPERIYEYSYAKITEMMLLWFDPRLCRTVCRDMMLFDGVLEVLAMV